MVTSLATACHVVIMPNRNLCFALSPNGWLMVRPSFGMTEVDGFEDGLTEKPVEMVKKTMQENHVFTLNQFCASPPSKSPFQKWFR